MGGKNVFRIEVCCDCTAGPSCAAGRASRWPIETLAVEGNRNYTSAQVLAVAGLKKGQMAGRAEFEAAYDRLVATGMFEKVDYSFAPRPAARAMRHCSR